MNRDTAYLAKGLLEGDKDRDRAIEVDELKVYLSEVERHARRLGYSDQKPMMKAGKEKVVIK